MTKIARSSIESTVVNKFLTILRANITDPISPARTNAKWIRSSVEVTETPTTNQGRKKYIVKEAVKPGYPQVVIGDYAETNIINTLKEGTDVNYRIECELTIYVLDVGHAPSVIGGLAGAISNILKTKKVSDFKPNGISYLEWTNISTPGYSDDDNTYNEKQISVTFIARIT